MSADNKIAIVVKGWYRDQDNVVFCVYLIDCKQQLIIPCDEAYGSTVDTSDVLSDLTNKLKKENYKIAYDIREDTFFNVQEFYPTLVNGKPVKAVKEKTTPFQTLNKHTICLN